MFTKQKTCGNADDTFFSIIQRCNNTMVNTPLTTNYIYPLYLVFVHKVESLSYNVQERGLRNTQNQGVDFRQ